MIRLAIATCAGDDVDIDTPVLLDACAQAGVDATMCIWDDPSVTWERFDLTVVRSTWDYAPRRDEFCEWADRVPRLYNPAPVIRYSTDKSYMLDLARRGFPVTPTTVCAVGEEPHFPNGDFVVKPCIGAGSIDAARYAAREDEAARAHVADLHARGRDVVVQPYLSSVDTDGEHALIFIDGVFSHAMTKAAMLNTDAMDRSALFRREQMSRATPDADALALGRAVMAEQDFSSLLYGRVDLLRDEDGWKILELELAEPSLFLSFCPSAAEAFVSAISRRV